MSSAAPENKPGNLREARIRDTAGQDRVLEKAPATRRLWILAAVMLSLVAVSVAVWPSVKRFSSAERSVPRERLRFAEVTRGDFIRDVAVRGRVVAAIKPTVYAPADGSVTLLVEAGDTVEKGAILARIQSPELTSQLSQERASLQGLETELTRQGIEKKQRELTNQQTTDLAAVAIRAAERELRRAQTSWDEQIISRQDYEKAGDDLARAKLEYEHAKQNASLDSDTLSFEVKTDELDVERQTLIVQELERRVDELAIGSPVNGMVGALAVDQRAAVAENQPLMTVVDLSAYEIEIQVPQEYGDDLGLGMMSRISVGQQKFDGAITAISPEVVDNQVTGRVRFAGAIPEGLRQNQRVSARVLLESRADVLTVKRGPFLDSGSGRVAYIVDGDLAHRQVIQAGAASISQVEILEGLQQGQTIVISDLAQFEGAETILLSD